MKHIGKVETGTGSAHITMHEWLNAWANSIGKSLYPGTLNIKINSKIALKGECISLKPWDSLFFNKWKYKEDYDPKLYPAKLNGYSVWIFDWGFSDKIRDYFEIVAEECLRDKFNLKDGDEVKIEMSCESYKILEKECCVMDKQLLISRFFTTNDKKIDKVVFPLPSYWWSRFYEYAWAAEFCEETDTVLDAACGIAHPFKFYIADKCKAIHAVDKDERVLNFSAMLAEMCKTFKLNKVELDESAVAFRQADITSLSYRNGMFDKVFCISALHHISDDGRQKALAEFRRVLKDDGMIILTIDYSKTSDYASMTMDELEAMAIEAGLKFASKKDSSIPENAINWNNGLYCFRAVLVKAIVEEKPAKSEGVAKVQANKTASKQTPSGTAKKTAKAKSEK